MTDSVVWVGLGPLKPTYPGKCAATVETAGFKSTRVMLIKFFQTLFTK